MTVRRSKKQIERLKKARSKRAGAARVRSQTMMSARWTKKNTPTGRTVGSYKISVNSGKRSTRGSTQPRPKLPLLSGGKDPTLGERFEEELYRS